MIFSGEGGIRILVFFFFAASGNIVSRSAAGGLSDERHARFVQSPLLFASSSSMVSLGLEATPHPWTCVSEIEKCSKRQSAEELHL